MTDATTPTALPLRRVNFTFPTSDALVWTRKPELAIAANSVSLLMPYVEPYVVRSVRSAISHLSELSDLSDRSDLTDPTDPTDLTDRCELPNRSDVSEQSVVEAARGFVRQEAQHHGQHRMYNELLAARYRGIPRIERWIDTTFRFLESHTSKSFGLAFAAGFETVAFCAARWVDQHADDVLLGADPKGASLFLWHLAEEVEHKTVAADVYRATGGGRVRYTAAMLVSAFILAWFAALGTLTMFWHERRLFKPVAHLRMFLWSLTFLFVLLPVMAVSVLPSHDPRDLSDPYRLRSWITGRFDGIDNMGVDVEATPGVDVQRP